MTDRDLMQQALEALTAYDGTNGASKRKRVLAALRERLARPDTRPATRDEKIVSPGVYEVPDTPIKEKNA